MKPSVTIFLVNSIALAFAVHGVRGRVPTPNTDLETAQWIRTSSKLVGGGRDQLHAVYDGEDSIYILGGRNYAKPSSIMRYSIQFDSVETIGTFMHIYSGSALMQGTEDIYYFGGEYLLTSNTGGWTSMVYHYSILTGNRTTVKKLPIPSFSEGTSFSATVLDPTRQVVYIFGGEYHNEGRKYLSYVLRFDPSTGQYESAGRLPKARGRAIATWDNETGLAYVFGGYPDQMSILKYDPEAQIVSEYTQKLPLPVGNGCAAVVGRDVYIYSYRSLTKFSLIDNSTKIVEVQDEPPYLIDYGCLYVPKLGRIYIVGGLGHYEGDISGFRDEISYITIKPIAEEPSTTPVPEDPPRPTTMIPTPEEPQNPTTTENSPPVFEDCSDGTTRTIPDPVCCESFYFCHGGEGTKFQCQDKQQFNPRTGTCDDPEVAKCGIMYRS